METHAMMSITVVGLWLMCAAVTYRMGQPLHAEESLEWVTAHRLFWLCCGVVLGPVGIFVTLLYAACLDLESTDWSQQKANW